MRRSTLLFLLGLAAAGACSDIRRADLGPDVNYDIEAVSPTATVRQDDTLRLATTVIRDNSVTIVGARILWAVDDDRIASVSSTGLVTAKAPGTTTVRASFLGDTATIALTVTPRTATSVSLTINHSRSHTGTGFALPGRADATWLRALVLAGTDTVYCNIGIACAQYVLPVPPRTQRLVEFVSLEPTEATISNAAATAGQITALDTTGSRAIGFVLRVRGDSGVAARWADTAWINFSVRPIDSIIAKPGTFTVLGANNAVITVNYGNNIARDSSMVLVIDQIGRRDSISTVQTGNPPVGGRTQVNIPITRPLPRVTWESANTGYAVVEASGRVQGLRNTWLAGDAPVAPPNITTGAACSTTPTRVTATDSAFNYDRVLTTFKIPDSVSAPTTANPRAKVAAPWFVPTFCAAGTGPVNVARGVHCTHAQTTPINPLATCTVLIRATVTDPNGSATDADGDGLPDNVKRFIYPVVIRNP